MAYKFQRGASILSGTVEVQSAEGEISVSGQTGVKTIELQPSGIISGSGAANFGSLKIGSAQTEVVSSALQLKNIATLDAITEATIEGAIDTLANLTSFGTNGAETRALGTVDIVQGIQINNTNFVDASRNIAAGNVIGAVLSGTAVQVPDGGLSFAGTAVSSTAAELNLVDGAQAGVIANSKAVIYDSKGAVTATGLTGSLRFSLDVAANSGLGMSPFNNSADVNNLAISASFLQAAAVAVATDQIMILNNLGQPKRESVTDLMTAVAGDGLGTASSQLKVNVDDSSIELNSDALRVKAGGVTDSMLNNDVATGLAGVGLSANAGVLALDLNELTAANMTGSSDSIAFLDGTATRKTTMAQFVDAIAGAGLAGNADGTISTQAGAVSEVISSTTALSEGYNYYTASVSKALTLPASPSVGDVVYIKAQTLADSAGITINKAGSHTIDGETSVVLESSHGAIGFVYLVANNWGII